MTEGHQRLGKLLADLGFVPEDEVPFGPYTVDCYIESLHVAFEYDGPQHSVTRDKKRDAYLFARHGLPVIRVTEMDPDEMLREMCYMLLVIWRDSASIRQGLSKG
jgi:very-short-patch-repair endonuclease